MAIDSTVKKVGILLASAAGIVVIANGTGYLTYQHLDGKNPNKQVLKDSVMSYTSIQELEDGSVVVERRNPFQLKHYEGDRDGSVNKVRDALVFGSDDIGHTFDKSTYHLMSPAFFREAQMDYREQIKRFKPYTNRSQRS